MFLTLLRKECVQYLKSVIYYIFIIYLAFDFMLQMGRFETVPKPEPDQESYYMYGEVETDDPALIMQASLDTLLWEWEQDGFVTYPVGFYKKITPSEEEKKQIQELINDMTGMTTEQVEKAHADYMDTVDKLYSEYVGQGLTEPIELDVPEFSIPIREDYSYETFLEKMEWLDNLLGGGSNYNEEHIRENAMQSLSYEQACQVYDDFIKKDKVTNAYARLFCDYEGITLALVTVFLAVTRGLRDRRAQAEQVIYAKRATSVKLVLSRYLAGVIMTLIPVFILNCVLIVQAIYYAGRLGVPVDYFAGVHYIGFWLVPTILVTLALGFFLTELTDSAIAILIQIAWWFVTLNANGLIGLARFSLIPRFNSLIGYQMFEEMCPMLLWNRCFYTVAAIVVLLLTILVYDRKRKGVFLSVGARLRNRKDKLEA